MKKELWLIEEDEFLKKIKASNHCWMLEVWLDMKTKRPFEIMGVTEQANKIITTWILREAPLEDFNIFASIPRKMRHCSRCFEEGLLVPQCPIHALSDCYRGADRKCAVINSFNAENATEQWNLWEILKVARFLKYSAQAALWNKVADFMQFYEKLKLNDAKVLDKGV